MISENRHYLQKEKERAKKVSKGFLTYWENDPNYLEFLQNQINHRYRNQHYCSCYVCRNPRHSPYYKGKSKLTYQERKALQKEE